MVNPCRSNLLPILITLFCCAGLFLFFNLRLNEIKITVDKQNRVLTSFITNVQQDIKAGGCAPLAEPTKHFAAPEALIAARKQEVEKIVVSDDEDSEDSDSESEDSESESDSDDERDDIKVVNLGGIIQMMPSTAFEPVSFEPVSFEPVSFEVLSCVNLCNETSIASESSITEIIEEPLNLVNLLGKEPAEETTLGKSDGEPNYEQMKVDDLRKIVTDKNLCTKEEGKKLKKPELLLLLKK
jgi:hypothetical protein